MHQLTKSMNKEDMNGNDLQTIITHGLDQIKEKMGPDFDIRKINPACIHTNEGQLQML